MSFFDETTHVTTPPISPIAPPLNENDTFTILAKHLLALDRMLLDLKNNLGKDRNMARATRVVNEIRYVLDKDQIGIEFPLVLINLIEVYVPSYNTRLGVTQGAMLNAYKR